MKKQVKQVNWNKLWSNLSDIYSAAGMQRQKAVLDNHIDQKEKICRKLGVVCEADIVRISNKISPTLTRKM
jgi:hypothetical protein